MCGVAGILAAGRPASWLDANAGRMTDALQHRGPDARGVWVDADASVALGHRRLSILDLSPRGAQPMVSGSGRYVIAYNGEIYNFRELRRQLEGAGVAFRGNSDTEVALAAFEAWGFDQALARFVGMFAFALWDGEARTLRLVRDRMGIKPMYWARKGPLFLFGSELKALAACDGWEAEVDRDALSAYVRWNAVPSPLCILRGAAKLAPGTVLTARAGGEPEIRTYWDLRAIATESHAQPADLDDFAAAGALEALLREAVAGRMIADVPLGAFLSGGTDSSLVLALMQAQSSRPVRSFSIGFEDKEYDEAPAARAVAEHLGTDHTELVAGPREALDVIPDLAEWYDEPFADSSQIPTYLVSRMTRRHVTVALSGDGGDELFAGYTTYRWAERVRKYGLGWPLGMRRAVAAAIDLPPRALWEGAAALWPGAKPQRLGERAGKLAAFLREPDADALYVRQRTHWTDPERMVPGAREPRAMAYDPALAADLPDYVRRMQLLDQRTYLPDDILTKVDRASMAVSLEARVPLLDHRVVEFTWTLPRHMIVRGTTDKWLLRQVLYRHVPRRLVERPKMGFGVPLARWLRGPLRDWAEALLAADRLATSFDPRPVRAAWEGFLAGRVQDAESLWGILMYEAWRERWTGTGARRARPPADRPVYYADKVELLRDLFGAEKLSVAPGRVVVDGKPYPVVDDVIVALEAERLPAALRERVMAADGAALRDRVVADGAATRAFATEVQAGFGAEWTTFRDILPEHEAEFRQYFDLVPPAAIESKRVCDLGCGTGRWSHFLKGRARELVLVDFSEAIFVARENLRDAGNAVFVMADITSLPFRDDCADLVVCLGVLHHLPTDALDEVRRLRRLAPRLLVYMYYALDGRPLYFRAMFTAADALRRGVSRVRSPWFRKVFTWATTFGLYLPLIGLGHILRPFGAGGAVPLHEGYRGKSPGRIRQDVYDRFFTTIEQRFRRDEILTLGDTFAGVTVSDGLPYWHFLCERT